MTVLGSPVLDRGRPVGAQIVKNQVYTPTAPGGQDDLLKEVAAVFAALRRRASADRPARLRTESGKELQGAVLAAVSIRATSGPRPPAVATPRNGLQRPEFVKTQDRTVLRRVAVEADYRVFLTSKSGPSEWHQVWPVKNRRPCR